MASIDKLLRHDFLEANEQLLEDFYSSFIFEDNLILTANGVVTSGVEITPLYKESLPSAEYERINSILNSIIKNLPHHTTFHLQTFYSAPSHVDYNSGEDGYFTRHLRRHLMDRPVNCVSMNLYLSFSDKPIEYNALITPVARFFKWVTSGLKMSPLESKLISRKQSAIDLTNTVLRMLNGIPGLKAKALLKEQLKLSVSRYASLNQFKQTVSLDTQISRDGAVLLMGLKNVAIVRLNQSGEQMHTHIKNKRGLNGFMMDGMGTSLNFPHVVNQVLVTKDTRSVLAGLRTIANMVRSMGNVGNSGNVELLKMFDSFIEKAITVDNPIVELHHNVITWSDRREELATQCSEILAAYNNANGSFGIIEDLDVMNWFMSMNPGMASTCFNGQRMLSHEAICNFDWSVEAISEGQGIIVCNRAGHPMHLDVWASWLSSKNAVVIGPTGSGKSFFTNNWIVQWFEQGYDLVIIDIGGSYKSITNILGGKYMDYDPANPISFNPFLLPYDQGKGIWVLTDDKRQFLISLITSLWKDSGQLLDKVEEAILSELINLFIQHFNKTQSSKPPKLLLFYEWLSDDDNLGKIGHVGSFDIFGLRTVLKRWCTGEFARVLNSDSTTDIADQQLVCFDLDAVKDIPSLRPVVALLIIEMVLDKMRYRKDKRKGIFMDEAWSFLGGSPELAKFMEYLFRTCRKQNAASVIISQSVLELSQSSVGRAIANNTPIKVILDHAGKNDQLPVLEEFFGFSEMDIDKIKSIVKNEKSREFFMKREETGGVYLLDAGPVSSTAFSSSPDDRIRMRDLVKRYRSYEYAITHRVEEVYS